MKERRPEWVARALESFRLVSLSKEPGTVHRGQQRHLSIDPTFAWTTLHRQGGPSTTLTRLGVGRGAALIHEPPFATAELA
jgi:hypothetical protein